MQSSIANESVGNTTYRLAAARAAATLKREKKVAAAAARVQGKIAAAEAWEKKAMAARVVTCEEKKVLMAKIARVRKAMGVRKNEENPAELKTLIQEWENEALLRRWKLSSSSSSS
jgi:hypothetical protein